jgi:hypothetical protein
MKLMKRWTIRIAVCFLMLGVVAVVAVYGLLRTDWPRRWVLQAVTEQTGLNVQARSVSIRWSGRTIVHDAVVKMPLDDRQVLSVDRLDLSHSSIPTLLVTRSFRLKSVRVARPQAFLWRDEHGRWNVQHVLDRLAAAVGSSRPTGAGMALPDVDVKGGLIEIIDPNGARQIVGPLDFQGIAERRLVWRFALQTPQGIGLHGRMAPGGNWTHQVEFDLAPHPAVLLAVAQRSVGEIRAAGRWSGRTDKGALRGTVHFDAFRAGPVALAGAVNVVAQATEVALHPEALVVGEPELFGETIRVTGGSIRIGSEGLKAEELLVRTETTAAQLSGRWGFDAQTGECSATWAGRLSQQGGEHSGTLHAVVKSPAYGLKEAQLTTTAEAQTAFGAWRVAVRTQGSGGQWRKSQWQTSLDKFIWTQRQQGIDLSGAAAEVSVDGQRVWLASLSLPNAGHVSADAELEWDTGRWVVRLDAKGLRLVESGQAGMDVRLHGEGDSGKAAISELRVAKGQTVVTGKGELSIASREIHTAHISARWPDRLPAPTASQPSQVQDRGQWGCEIDISGTVYPVALDAGGTLSGRDVRLGKRKVAQLEIPVQGSVDTERVEIATSPFALVGGRWQLSGRHELSDPRTELSLTIDGLSLQTAAEMAGSPIECQGEATAQLQLSVPNFQMDKALAFGNWEVADLNVPPFEAQRGHGQIRISEGLVRFDEIHLAQEQGQAHGVMQFRLDQPQRLSIQFNSTDWPLRWNSQLVGLMADSDADLQLDLLKKSLDGQGRLSGRLMWEDKEFGRVDTSVRLRERMLEIDELRSELLGGSAEGSAQVRLDRLTQSTGQLQWRDIQPEQLASWWPAAARAGGRLSGSLTAVQTTEQSRPLEPLRLDIQARMADGRFGEAQVGDCNVVAYLGNRRFLVDASTLHVLGGEIRVRARVSPHAGKLYLSVAADVNDVDLNQLGHVADPNAKPIVGKLSGKGTLLTSSDWRHLSGQADLHVTQSDLVNNAIVRTLYDTLSLDLGQSRPEGTGQMDVVFEGNRVRIPSFVYFNRGVEVRGAVRIVDYTLGADSPMDGYAVGSTRVLKGMQLPGVRQLDRLMSSLQTGIASVTIKGTVGQTQINVVPLPVIGDAFRGLLWTQLRDE